jgi:diguanylate cyclase (GGDEF)-like protein
MYLVLRFILGTTLEALAVPGAPRKAPAPASGAEGAPRPSAFRALLFTLILAAAGSALALALVNPRVDDAAVALFVGVGVLLGRVYDLSGRLRSELVERRRAEGEARFLAYHDALTSLPNRLLLGDRLAQELAHAARDRGTVGVFLVDLDRFNVVNDSLGHKAGDELVKAFAGRLQAAMRASDTVARLGGDEFAVIVPRLSGPDAAGIIARKLLRLLEAPVTIPGGHDIYVTASVGGAIFPSDGEDADTLLKHADLALYRAKEQGRRTFHLWSDALTAKAMRRMELERDLRGALARNELSVHYQPQVDLATGRIVGMEALMRWKGQNGKMISPADFIPVAEESGLIVPLGDWVLEQAARQASAWHALGHRGLRVSVNLSVAQLRERDLAERFAAILERTGLDPALLELEVTEALVLRNDAQSRGQIDDLRRKGVRLAIDDFGTGYSSLAYLTRLPVDSLKIDRSFVCELEAGSNTEAVVRAIMGIAHSLDLRVIAEGVETDAQRQILSTLGSHEMQGYLFSPPVPPDQATGLLERQRVGDPSDARVS